MSLADRITRLPLPHDAARGREVAAAFDGAPGDMQALVAGMAGSSAFLAGLAEREVEWLSAIAGGAPEDAADALLDIPQAEGRAALMRDLRTAKRRAALLTALCDLGGIWTLEEVTGTLTRLADTAVVASLALLHAEAVARGKLPETDAPLGGLFVLAMGKMGARELNYSSDIDLIALFDEARYPGDDYPEVRQGFIRIVQQMSRMLSDVTGDGYVFRTDLRLRPDPSVTPVCIGAGAAERYYESQGRTWERAAMIKARVCAGDRAAGARFLDDIAPFIWRRHLDFAAIRDAHDMRLRIREHKGLGGPIVLPGHDVKLGRGGIREIEFFAQTRQLICGGRDPSLRLRATKPALDALMAGGWVDGAAVDGFKAAYTAHRELEHRIQMLEDAQTHRYPKTAEGRRRIAALCGADDLAAFEAPILARFQSVHERAEAFFAHETGSGGAEDAWAGLGDDPAIAEIVEGWHGLPALKSERSREIFARLATDLAGRLAGAAEPLQAIRQFDSFLKGLPAGVQVLSLFEANPQILDLLVDICATAPKLAEYLGRNAGVLDAVLTRGFYEQMPPLQVLRAEAAAQIGRAGDYEGQLDAARIWMREQAFRVGVHLLRGLSTPREAGAAYSDIADAVLAALLPRVEDAFAVRHGRIAGGALAIIGMGKLGSREMTTSSDLDLIAIYDAPEGAESTGVKALPAKMYYARLTQALINALTAPTAQGVLYEVDMRLRPSGRQGPVATSLNGFAAYQRDEAWTWEHLALTRARVVVGAGGLGAAVEAAISGALEAERDRAKILDDVREMRARLGAAKARAAEDPWELKQGPGRMLDIELALQTGRLLCPAVASRSPYGMIAGLRDCGFLDSAQGGVLAGTLDLFASVQQLGRLALAEGFAPRRGGPGLAALLCRVTGAESLDGLEARLAEEAGAAAEVIAALLEAP